MGARLRLASFLIAIVFVAGCTTGSNAPAASPDQSSAEATLRTFYSAIQANDTERIAGLVRTKEGTALSTIQDAVMRDGLKRVFAGGAVHVTAVRVTSSGPLESEAMQLLPVGTTAARLVFAVDGTGNACLPLPIINGTGSFAQLQGRWYVLEERLFGLPFSSLNC